MAKKIAIIGAGPGGYVAAIRAAQLGAEVTLIEQESVGGTCLNRGCIPSKVIKTTAEMTERFNRAGEFGLRVNGSVSLDMQHLMAKKEKVIRDQARGILKLFKHHKIRYLEGSGQIEQVNLVRVRLLDGSMVDVPWDSLILAPGSRPLDIPSFPFDCDRILSSNDALDIRDIPESILIVGGGVIGCEFAFIFKALGANVIIVEAMSRILPLPSVDEDCSKTLQREMKKRKIEFMVNRIMEKVEHDGKRCVVTIGPSPFARDLRERDKEPLTLNVEKILVCIGRKPNTGGIGLDKINVKMDEKGWVIVNERMETSVPAVYAVGDVLGPARIMLAHVASTEGLTAAENAMDKRRIMRYDVVPGGIFTMPEVANVGLTEAQAKEQDYNVRSDTVLFRNLGKAQVMGEIAGQAKIISDAESGKILGVHLVGPHATDLIAEGALAMQAKCTVRELSETIHAHPTLSEIMLETSLKALDKSLHG